jgi:hypothetical protein
MYVKDWYTFGNKIWANYKAYPHITGISGKSNSQTSNLAVYLHITCTCIYLQAPQLSEITSLIEMSFCVIKYAKTNSCTGVQPAIYLFLWGYIKWQVFVPHLPLYIDELKLIITTAIETTDRNMLERLWDELEYRPDICRVTNRAHIEHH